MPINIGESRINRFLVIDDDEAMRDSAAELINDMGIEAMPISGPLDPLPAFIGYHTGRADAAIADFHLKPLDYAVFDGAELVSAWYDLRFPALLCSRFEQSDIDEIRIFRRKIPVLLAPDKLNEDNIIRGIEIVVNELSGDFVPSRRGWKTLIRIEEIDSKSGFFWVIVPAWDSNDGIRLRTITWPSSVVDMASAPTHLFADVNLNAEKQEELYFDNWSIDN